MHEQLRKLQSSMMKPWLQNGQKFLNIFRHGKNIQNFFREIAFRRKKKHKTYPDTLQTINRVKLRPGETPLLIIRCTLQHLHFKLIGLSSRGQVALLYMFLTLGLTIGLTETQLIDHTTAVNTNDVFTTIDHHSDSGSRTNTLFPSFADNAEYTKMLQESISSERDKSLQSSEMLLSSFHIMSSLTEKLEISQTSLSVHTQNNPETVSDTTTASLQFQSFPIPLSDTTMGSALMTSYYTTYKGNQPGVDLETWKASTEFEPYSDSMLYKNEESSLLVTYYTTRSNNQPDNPTQTSKESKIFQSSTDSLRYIDGESSLLVSYYTVQSQIQPEMDTKTIKLSVLLPDSLSTNLKRSLMTNYHTALNKNEPEDISETIQPSDQFLPFTSSMPHESKARSLMTNYHTTQHDNDPVVMSETRKASEQFSSFTSLMPHGSKAGSLMTSYHKTQHDNEPEAMSETSQPSDQFLPFTISMPHESKARSLITNYHTTQHDNDPEVMSGTSTASEQFSSFTSLMPHGSKAGSLMTSYHKTQHDNEPEAMSETSQPSDQFLPFTTSMLHESKPGRLMTNYYTTQHDNEPPKAMLETSERSDKFSSFSSSVPHESKSGGFMTNYYTTQHDNEPEAISETSLQSDRFLIFTSSMPYESRAGSLMTSYQTEQHDNEPEDMSETNQLSDQFPTFASLMSYKSKAASLMTSYHTTYQDNEPEDMSETNQLSDQFQPFTTSMPYESKAGSLIKSYQTTQHDNEPEAISETSKASEEFSHLTSSMPYGSKADSLITNYQTTQYDNEQEAMSETSKRSDQFLSFTSSIAHESKAGSFMTKYQTKQHGNEPPKAMSENSKPSNQFPTFTSSMPYESRAGDLMQSYQTTQDDNEPEDMSETSRLSDQFQLLTSSMPYESKAGSLMKSYQTTLYDNEPEAMSETSKALDEFSPFISSMPYESKAGTLVTTYHTTQHDNEPKAMSETSKASEQFLPFTSSMPYESKAGSLMTSYQSTQKDNEPDSDTETGTKSDSFHVRSSLTTSYYATRNLQGLEQNYSTALNGFELETDSSSTISIQPTPFADSLRHSTSEGSLGTSYHMKQNDNLPNTDSEILKQSLHFTSFPASLQFHSVPSSLRTSFFTVQYYSQRNTSSETSETSKQFSPFTSLLSDKSVESSVKTIYYSRHNDNGMKTDSETGKPSVQFESSAFSLLHINEESSLSTSYYRKLSVNRPKTGSVSDKTSTQYKTFWNSKPFSNIGGSLVTSYYTTQISDQLETDPEPVTTSVHFMPFSFSLPTNNVENSLKTTYHTAHSTKQSEKYTKQSQASEQLTYPRDSSQQSQYSAVEGNLRSSYFTTQNKYQPEKGSETNLASTQFSTLTDTSLYDLVDRDLRTSFYTSANDEQSETDSKTNEMQIQSTAFIDSSSLKNVKSRLKTVSSAAPFDATTSKFDQSSTKIILHAISTATTIQIQEFLSQDISPKMNDEIITGTLNLELDIKPTNSFKISDNTSKVFHSEAKNSKTLQMITTTELQSMTTHFDTTFAEETQISSVEPSRTLTSSQTLKSSPAETEVQLMSAIEGGTLAQNTIADQVSNLCTSCLLSNVVISSTTTWRLDYMNSNKALVSSDKTTVQFSATDTSVTTDYITPQSISKVFSDTGSLSTQRRGEAKTKISKTRMPTDSSHKSYTKSSALPHTTSLDIDFRTQYALLNTGISNTAALFSSLQPAVVDSSNYDLSEILKITESGGFKSELHSEKVVFGSEYSSVNQNKLSASTAVLSDTPVKKRTTKSFELSYSEMSGLPKETIQQRDRVEGQASASSVTKTAGSFSLPELENHYTQINIGLSVRDSAQLVSSEKLNFIASSYSIDQNQHMTQSPVIPLDQHRFKSSVHESIAHSESSSVTMSETISSSHWDTLTQELTAEIPMLPTSFDIDWNSLTRSSFLDHSLDSFFHILAYDTLSTRSYELEQANDDELLENLKAVSLFSTASPVPSKRGQFSSTYLQMSLDVIVRNGSYENWIASKIMENTSSVPSTGTEIDTHVVKTDPAQIIQSTLTELDDKPVLNTSIRTRQHDTVTSSKQLQYSSGSSQSKSNLKDTTNTKSTISFEWNKVITHTSSSGLTWYKSLTSKSSISTAQSVTGSSYSPKALNTQSLYAKIEQESSINVDKIAFQSSSQGPGRLLSGQSQLFSINNVMNSNENLNHLDSGTSTCTLNLMSSTFISEMPITLLDNTNRLRVSVSSVVGFSNEESNVFAPSELVQSLQDYENRGHTVSGDFAVIMEISSPSTEYTSVDYSSLKKNKDIDIVSSNEVPVSQNASLENYDSSYTSSLSRITATGPKSSAVFIPKIPLPVSSDTRASESLSASASFDYIFQQSTKIREEEVKFSSNTGLEFDIFTDDVFSSHSGEQITTSFSMIIPVTFSGQRHETAALSLDKFSYPVKETHYVSDFTSSELVTPDSGLNMNITMSAGTIEMNLQEKSISAFFYPIQPGDSSINSSFGSIQPGSHQITNSASHTRVITQTPLTFLETSLPETRNTPKETISQLEKISLTLVANSDLKKTINSESVFKISSLIIESESARKDADYSQMPHGQIQFSKESTSSFYLGQLEHLMTEASSVEKENITSYQRNGFDYSEGKSLTFPQTNQSAVKTITPIIVSETKVINIGKITFEASLTAPSNTIKISTFKQTESFSTMSEFLEIQSTLEDSPKDIPESYTNSLASRYSMPDLLTSYQVSSSQVNFAANNKLESKSVPYTSPVRIITPVENLSTELVNSDKPTDKSTLFTLPDISFHSEMVSILSTNPLQEDLWQPEKDSKHTTTFGNFVLFPVVMKSDTPLPSDASVSQGGMIRTSLKEFQEWGSKHTRSTLNSISLSTVSEMNSPALNITSTEKTDILNLPSYVTKTEIHSSSTETRFFEKAISSDKTDITDVSNYQSVNPSERPMADIVIMDPSLSVKDFSVPDKATTILEADSGNSESNFEEMIMTSSSYLPMFSLQSVYAGLHEAAVSLNSTSNIAKLSDSTVTSNSSYHSSIIFATPTYQTKSLFISEGFTSESAMSSFSIKRGGPFSMFASSGSDKSFSSNLEIGFSPETAAFTFSTHTQKEELYESERLEQIRSPVLSSVSLVLQPTSSIPYRKSYSVIHETFSALRKNQNNDVSATKSTPLIQSLLNSWVNDISHTSGLHIRITSDDDKMESTFVYDRKQMKSRTTKTSKVIEMYGSSSMAFMNDPDKAISTTNNPPKVSPSLDMEGLPFLDKAKISSTNTESNRIISSSPLPIQPVIVQSMTEKIYLQDIPLYASSGFVESYQLSHMKTGIETDSTFTTDDIFLSPEEGSHTSLFSSTLSNLVHKIETNSKSTTFFEPTGMSSISSYMITKKTWESSTVSKSDYVIQPTQPKSIQTSFTFEPPFESPVRKSPDGKNETTSKPTNGLSSESGFSSDTSRITESQNRRFPEAHSGSTLISLWKTRTPPITLLSDIAVISSAVQSSSVNEGSVRMAWQRTSGHSTEFGITLPYNQIFSSNSEELPYSSDEISFSLQVRKTVAIYPSFESTLSKSFSLADDSTVISESVSTSLKMEQSPTLSDKYLFRFTADTVYVPTKTIQSVSFRHLISDLSSTFVFALSPSEVELQPPSTDSDETSHLQRWELSSAFTSKRSSSVLESHRPLNASLSTSIPHYTSFGSEANSIQPKSDTHNKLLESEKIITVNSLSATSQPSTSLQANFLQTSIEFSSPSQSFLKGGQVSHADSSLSLSYFPTIQLEETTSVDKTLSVIHGSSVISLSLKSQTLVLYPTIDLKLSGWDIQSSSTEATLYFSDDILSFQKFESTLTDEQSSTPRQYSGPLFPSFGYVLPRTKAHHSSIPILQTSTNFLADNQLDFYSSTLSEDMPDMHVTTDASPIFTKDTESDRSSIMLTMRDDHTNEGDRNNQTPSTSKSLHISTFHHEMPSSKYLSSAISRYLPAAEQDNHVMSASSEPPAKTLERSSLSSSSASLQPTFPTIMGIAASYNITSLVTIINSYETSSFTETASVGNKQEISTSPQISVGYFTSPSTLFKDMTIKYLSTNGSQTPSFSLTDSSIIPSSSEELLINGRSIEAKSPVEENAITMQTIDSSWFSSLQHSSVLPVNTIRSHVYSVNGEFTFKRTQYLMESKSTDETDKTSFTILDTVSSGVVENSHSIILVSAVSSNSDLYGQNFVSSSTSQIVFSASEYVESWISLRPSYHTASETYKVNGYPSLSSATKESKTYDHSYITFKKQSETEPLMLTTNSLDSELPSISEAQIRRFSQSGSHTDLHDTSASAKVDLATAKSSTILVSSTTAVDQTLENPPNSSVSFALSTVDQLSAKPSTTSIPSAKNSISTHPSALASSFNSVTLDPENIENSGYSISKTPDEHFQTLESSLETSYLKGRDSSTDGDVLMTQTLPHKPSFNVSLSSSSDILQEIISDSMLFHSETRAETLEDKMFVDSTGNSAEQSLKLISTFIPRRVSQSTDMSNPVLEEGGISSSELSYTGSLLSSGIVVSKSSKIAYPPANYSTLFHETVYNSSKTSGSSLSFNVSTVSSVSTPVLTREIGRSFDSLRINISSQTLDRSPDYTSNNVPAITTSVWPTRSTDYLTSSTVVFIASTSISLSPSIVNSSHLLTIKILVKQSIDLTDTGLREELEKGLQACYEEGVNKMQSVIGRKKRQDETTNGIQVQVDSLARDPNEPANVDVEFYVLDNGEAVSATIAEDALNQLSLVEMSAYLAYPVITRARAVIQTVAPEEQDDNSTFPALIVIPVIACMVAVILIVLAVYCCRRKRLDRPLTLKNSFVSSLSLKKPTLDEMDLMVDMEKGEVVSRKSNNSTLTVKPSHTDTNTINRMFKQLQKTGAERMIDTPLRLNDVSYFQRSLSEMCSPHARLERLRKLGLNVTEVGNARSLYKINEARSNVGNGIEIKEENIKQTIEVTDLDESGEEKRQDLTPYSASVACQCDNSQTISEDQNLIQADQEEKLWHSVTFMANEGYLSDSSYRTPTIDKNKPNIKNAKGKVKQGKSPSLDKHSRKNYRKQPPDDKSNTRHGQRTKNVRGFREDHRANHGKHPVSFEKYENEFFGTPLTSSTQVRRQRKEPLNIYRGDNSDAETDTDSVFLPSIQDSEAASVSVFDTDIDIVSDQYYESELYTDMDERNDQFNTLDNETVIPERGYTKHRLQEAPVEAINDIMYRYFKPIDKPYLIKGLNQYPDGSEYAGHEFDSVNFSSYYKTSQARKQRKHLGRRRGARNMAEGILQYTEPGDPRNLEHVTKMGRVSSQGLSVGRSCRPQFRDISYQPSVLFPSIPKSEPVKELENISDTEGDKKEKNGQQGSIQPNCTENQSLVNGQENGPNTESFTVVEGKTLEFQPKPVNERPQPQPYEEMKLGRNMRAVPRGGVRAATSDNMQLDSEANEPLLATNPPPNLVVDYLSNTSSSITAQTYNLNSRQTPNQLSVRSIASPQHPSQDLIEMLHRNQSLSISRLDEQQRMADERRRKDERKSEEERWQQERRAEEMERQRAAEEVEKSERERKEMWKKQEEIRQERERREEEYKLEIERKNREEMERRNREEIERKNREEIERIGMERDADVQHQQDMHTKNDLLQDAFPLSFHFSTGKDLYTAKDLRQPKRSTDQGSSLPFSPHSGSLNYETETGGMSSSTAQRTDTFHGKAGESKSFGKQETVDEVQDIEEDIEVEQASDSDDQFKF